MGLDDASTARFLIRDRDGKFPALFDDILADADIQVVLTGVRIPRMNAIMERWIRSCRRELLDRTLIWNQSTYSTPYASTSTSITPTDPTKASPTPNHYALCPTHHEPSSPHPPRHPPTTAVGRHPQRAPPPRRLTCADDVFGRHSGSQATDRQLA
ncbi:hypothetical protein [Actinosynnema sp. NPDC023587]|uniref:hypothetical protein n=1 Tax=Actinosynnema sp. NPDC023587 TaxID=3154695 RepID=UPI0033D8326F